VARHRAWGAPRWLLRFILQFMGAGFKGGFCGANT
jgi:hypothetical protein